MRYMNTANFVIMKFDGKSETFVWSNAYGKFSDSDKLYNANFYPKRKHAEKDMRRYAKELQKKGEFVELQVLKILAKQTLSGCVTRPETA